MLAIVHTIDVWLSDIWRGQRHTSAIIVQCVFILCSSGVSPTFHAQGYFSFSSPMICCCGNWIWNPRRSIVSEGLFQKYRVIPCISDLMRSRGYWCHIKQPLGSCALRLFYSLYVTYWLKISPRLHALSCLTHITCCFLTFPSLGVWDPDRRVSLSDNLASQQEWAILRLSMSKWSA